MFVKKNNALRALQPLVVEDSKTTSDVPIASTASGPRLDPSCTIRPAISKSLASTRETLKMVLTRETLQKWKDSEHLYLTTCKGEQHWILCWIGLQCQAVKLWTCPVTDSNTTLFQLTIHALHQHHKNPTKQSNLMVFFSSNVTKPVLKSQVDLWSKSFSMIHKTQGHVSYASQWAMIVQMASCFHRHVLPVDERSGPHLKSLLDEWDRVIQDGVYFHLPRSQSTTSTPTATSSFLPAFLTVPPTPSLKRKPLLEPLEDEMTLSRSSSTIFKRQKTDISKYVVLIAPSEWCKTQLNHRREFEELKTHEMRAVWFCVRDEEFQDLHDWQLVTESKEIVWQETRPVPTKPQVCLQACLESFRVFGKQELQTRLGKPTCMYIVLPQALETPHLFCKENVWTEQFELSILGPMVDALDQTRLCFLQELLLT